MSLSFPLSADAFFGALGAVLQCDLRLVPGQETSGLGSGMSIIKDLRPPVWKGSIGSTDLDDDQRAEMLALIDALSDGLNTFLAFDWRRQYPKLDSGGTILGSSSVTVDGTSGSFGLALAGLPAGYVLSRGDLLSWNDGTSYRLHRVVEESATADGSGDIAAFEVRPKISAATASPQAVTLVKAVCEARIVPGSVRVEGGGLSHLSRISFDLEQVLRG